jgi:hypothetical protein
VRLSAVHAPSAEQGCQRRPRASLSRSSTPISSRSANASDDNAVDGDGGGGGVEVDAAAAAGSEADLLGVRGACRSYLDLLCAGAMLFVQGQTDARHSPQFRDRNSIVQTAAAEFLQYLLTKITSPERARVVAHNVRVGVLRTLSQAVVAQSLVLQVYLLAFCAPWCS